MPWARRPTRSSGGSTASRRAGGAGPAAGGHEQGQESEDAGHVNGTGHESYLLGTVGPGMASPTLRSMMREPIHAASPAVLSPA